MEDWLFNNKLLKWMYSVDWERSLFIDRLRTVLVFIIAFALLLPSFLGYIRLMVWLFFGR